MIMDQYTLNPMVQPRFDLERIEKSLREVQKQLPLLNQKMKPPREQMDDEVVENLLSGYALVNQLLVSDIELLALGSSRYLLELNARVLCGASEQKRQEYTKHILATNRYFYERTDAGIHALMEWYALHRHQSMWHRAAGLYINVLSMPQLFIEGNDRTGTLLMSYILAKEGKEPFVLTTLNAKAYFEFSGLVKTLPANSLTNVFRLSILKNRIANFLKNQSAIGSRN